MKFFLLSLLFLSLLSCVASEPENGVFRDRGKTETRPRLGLNQANQNEENQDEDSQAEEDQTEDNPVENNPTEPNNPPNTNNPAEPAGEESFVFPVQITKDLSQLMIQSSDNRRIHLSASGGDMILLAPQSGSLSTEILEDHYHLTIVASKDRMLNFLLEKSKTTLKLSETTQVAQRQLIAQTSGPVVLYISKDGEDLVLCLGDISASIPIIKDLSLENCN